MSPSLGSTLYFEEILDWKRVVVPTDVDKFDILECPTLTMQSYMSDGPQCVLVTERQLRLMKLIYHNITRFPDGVWSEIIARTIGLHGARVLAWFKQERDKDQRRKRTFREVAIQHRNPCGPRCWVLRLPAFDSCFDKTWTDEYFGDILTFLDFWIAARMRASPMPQIKQESDSELMDELVTYECTI